MPARKREPTPAEEAPFLAEIRAHLEDDAPRLVFADWLEERGDPRAEFIRVQCSLARLDALDPARKPLEDRERELLTAHGVRWRRRLPEVAHGAWGIAEQTWAICPSLERLPESRHCFTRGMPQAGRGDGFTISRLHAPVEMDKLGVRQWTLPSLEPRHAQLLADSPRLDLFTALLCNFSHDERFFRSPRLHNVERLGFYASYQATAEIENLIQNPGLQQLRYLKIGFFPGEGLPLLLGWPGFAALSGLSITLEPNMLVDASLLAASPASSKLTELAINRGIAYEAMYALFTSPHLTRLTTLQLGGDLGEGEAPELLRACTLPALQHLSFQASGALTEDACVEALVDTAYYPRLRSLVLSGGRLGDAAATALAEHPGSAGLEFLDLSNNRIGQVGVEAILRSQHLQGLRKLNLSRNDDLPDDTQQQLKKVFGKRLKV